MRIQISRLLLMGFLALVWSIPAVANYKEIYNQALEAVDDKNWPLAKALFEAAATAEPKPKNRVRLYGMKYFSYLPYFNLARANFELKNCDDALKNAQLALDYGVVSDKGSEIEWINRITSECQPNLLEEGVEQRLATLNSRKTSFDRDVANYRGESLLADQWRPGQELAVQADSVTKAIRDLEGRLGNPAALSEGDLDGLDRQLSDIESAANNFKNQARLLLQAKKLDEQERLTREADIAKREEERKQREALIATLRGGVDSLGELLEKWPAEIAATSERRELESIRQAYVESGNMNVAELGDLGRRLDRALKAGETRVQQYRAELASRPPDELVAAVDEYFKGNFRQSLSLLEKADLDSGRAGYYKRLFIAASQYHLSFSADERERQQLMTSAQDNIRSAFAIERRQLDARAFSPRFVEFANATVN